MNREPTDAKPNTVAPDTAVPADADTPPSDAAQSRATGGLSPLSLVPSLTLIAMHFLQEELGPWDRLFSFSMGNGGHRPKSPR
jgi:hypothetical protein